LKKQIIINTSRSRIFTFIIEVKLIAVYPPLMRSALRCSRPLQRSSEFFNKLKEDTLEGIDITNNRYNSTGIGGIQPLASAVSAVSSLRATWDDPTQEELLEDAHEDDIAAIDNNKVSQSIARIILLILCYSQNAVLAYGTIS
jgi:hypothetical protein